MPIKCIGLKNFTVFEDFRLEVSSGINVFVGENGTGKTHLLKALYAACEITKDKSLGANFLEKCFKNHGSVDFFKNDKNRELDVYLKADCNNKEYIAVILTVPIVRNIKNVRSNVASVLSRDCGQFILTKEEWKQKERKRRNGRLLLGSVRSFV